jgi:hypothetical protein
MTMHFDQQTEFAARVERIRAGGQGTNRTLYVGMDGAMAIPRDFRSGRQPKGKGRIRRWLLAVLVIGAATAGATQAGVSFADLMLPA